MKTQRRRGFTVVELVVVIAIIAVLAAVLIPTFTSIIKKANDSAYLQERTNQKLEDLAEKVDKINYFTWEDFEKKLAEELAKVDTTGLDETALNAAVTSAVTEAMKEYSAHSQTSTTGLTADQVKKIVDEAMAGQLTTAQVEAIVRQAAVGKSVDVNAIANQVIAKLPKTTGITKEEMQSAIKQALAGLEISSISDDDIAKALAAFGVSTLTEEDIKGIISSATNDNTTLAKALNIKLAYLGIGKQKTVYDMVVKIGGESVITGTNGTSTLLYDLENNKFFTVKDGVVDYDGGLSLSGTLTEKYKYWIFANSVSETYSTYLLSGSILTSAPVSTGIDVGENTEVTSITYDRSTATSAQDVVIRTNSAGTTLTINAPDDSISHYGIAGSVIIEEIKTSSYHENGKVAFLEIGKGRIVLEPESDVEHIHIDKKENANEFDTIIIKDNGTQNLPKAITRDEVNVSTQTLVVTVESASGEQEEVFVYANGTTGTTEQTSTQNTDVDTSLGVLVLDNGSHPGEKALDADKKEETKEETIAAVFVTITASVETIGDGETFQFVATGSNISWSSSDSDVATISQTGLLTATGVGQTTITVTDGEQVKTCDVTVTYFHDGEGTENNQLIIANRKQLLNTGLFYYQNGYNFKVMDGVTEIDCSNWETIKYFGGTLDGNGVTLANLDAPLVSFVWDGLKNSTATFKNLNINCNMHYNDDRGAIITYSAVKNTVFDNVNIHGLIESSLGCSPYIGYGAYGYNYYYFNNCVSNVSLVATGGAASGFVNHPSYSEAEGANPSINAKIFITDSLYNGNISAANSSGNNFKYFVVNSNGLAVTTKYSDEFISQYGNPEGTLYATPNGSTANDDGSKTFNAGNYGSNLVDYYTLSDNKAVLSTLTVSTPAKGEAFEINKLANASKIIITLEIGANDENGYGNYVGTYEIEEINVSSVATGSQVSSSSILNFHVIVVPANNTDKTTGAEGDTYYVVSGRNGSTYGSAVVRITQYDIYGNVLGTKAISIAE